MKTIVTFSNGRRWASLEDHRAILEYAALYADTQNVSFWYSVEEEPNTETLISDRWNMTIYLN